MDRKRVQTDQGYQSRRLPGDWTRTHEDTDHFSKGPETHPRLKNNPRGLILSEGLMFQKRLVFWRIDAYKGTP